MSARSAKLGFPLIQALRAGAAFAVAITHILHDAMQMRPGNSFLHRLDHAMPWGAGVDVFFVISGFVITYSSRSLFARPGALQLFLTRRLSRIVPLYWALSALFLLQFALSPGTIHGAIGGTGYILKSFAFIPAARPDGLLQPPLGLGWTLNYEMFFYAVFTPFLLLPRRFAVPATVACLTAFVLTGMVFPFPGVVLPFWANPIILEFCAGMLLALLPGRITLPVAVRALLTVAALAALHFHSHEGPQRFYDWGIPAVVLVLAASTGKPVSRLPLLELWLVRFGDASYAMYLAHPFIMRGVTLLWRHTNASLLLYAALCLVLAQTAALLLHHFGERPVTAWLRGKFEPRLSETASDRSPAGSHPPARDPRP
jgi:peptidoglycan/LPS O-acetylase OafA/YrhL